MSLSSSGVNPIKLLMFQETIPSYRSRFFLSVSKHFAKMTIVTSSREKLDGDSRATNVYQDMLGQIEIFDLKIAIKNIFYNFRTLSSLIADHDLLVIPTIFRLRTFVLLFMARRGGKKVIGWGIGHMPQERFWKKIIRGLFYRLFDRIIFYSRAEQYLYSCLGLSGKTSLDYFINSNALDPVPGICISPEYEPKLKFVYVGRLHSKARLDIAFEAFSLLKQKGLQIEFGIVGDGSGLTNYRKTAGRLGVDQSITWYGPCYDDENLSTILHHYDYFLYPGAIGLSIFTAFSRGLPLITNGDAKMQAPEFYFSTFENSIYFNGDGLNLSNVLIQLQDLSSDVYFNLRSAALDTSRQNSELLAIRTFTNALLAQSK